MSELRDSQVEDHVHYGIGGEERLIEVRPKITPDSSPEPTSKPVSPSTSKSGEVTKRRRKARPSKGDSYLLRISFPNATEVHRQAEHYLPNGDSGGEEMEEEEDVADMDERLARDMERAELEKEQARLAEEKKKREQERSQIEFAAKALSINSPTQQPTPTDRMDLDHDPLPQPDVSENIPQRKPNLSGLLIDNVKSDPQPQLMSSLMTPMEPRFSDYDTAFLNSPFIKKRDSVDSPKEQLPAMQMQSPASPEGPASPPQLPSARSIFEIADKANRQRQTSFSMPAPGASPHPNGYRSSFSNAVPSPSMHDPTSPRSTLALSPPSAFFPRRESYPSLTSVKTNESYSNSDGTSPNTLPTPQSDHRPSIDETNPRMLPLPHPDMHRPSVGSISTIPASVGGFKCDFPGCTAPPFQTSYLLNSHANVHSSNRPHYCPVQGCPRAEGGKGFKRKNEMIRHGLVHDSPGYVCPFCPDREHKYPRPDNLQRHVRVHHTDKNKDDPLLREVLAQRPELGSTRGRRRRLLS